MVKGDFENEPEPKPEPKPEQEPEPEPKQESEPEQESEQQQQQPEPESESEPKQQREQQPALTASGRLPPRIPGWKFFMPESILLYHAEVFLSIPPEEKAEKI